MMQKRSLASGWAVMIALLLNASGAVFASSGEPSSSDFGPKQFDEKTKKLAEESAQSFQETGRQIVSRIHDYSEDVHAGTLKGAVDYAKVIVWNGVDERCEECETFDLKTIEQVKDQICRKAPIRLGWGFAKNNPKTHEIQLNLKAWLSISNEAILKANVASQYLNLMGYSSVDPVRDRVVRAILMENGWKCEK